VILAQDAKPVDPAAAANDLVFQTGAKLHLAQPGGVAGGDGRQIGGDVLDQ